MAWIWYVIVQLLQLLASLAGVFVLAIPCCFEAWSVDAKSIKDGRPISTWSWSPLSAVYGNPEDGVSGAEALVGGQPYMPDAPAIQRAYYWSALRNSADNLKYVFAWAQGPFVTWTYTLLGKQHTVKLGWQLENGFKVPVFSLW